VRDMDESMGSWKRYDRRLCMVMVRNGNVLATTIDVFVDTSQDDDVIDPVLPPLGQVLTRPSWGRHVVTKLATAR